MPRMDGVIPEHISPDIVKAWKNVAEKTSGSVQKKALEVVKGKELELANAKTTSTDFVIVKNDESSTPSVNDLKGDLAKPKRELVSKSGFTQKDLEAAQKSVDGTSGDVQKQAQARLREITMELIEARKLADEKAEIVPTVGGDSSMELALDDYDGSKELVLAPDKQEIVPKRGLVQVIDKFKALMKIEEPESKSIVPFESHEPQLDIIVPPKKATPTTRFKAAVVAAKGALKTKILYRDKFGHEHEKTQDAKELAFKEAAFFGAMISHNSQEINDPELAAKMSIPERASKRVVNFFDNFLRGTMTGGLHAGKEQRHAIKLMAAAGVEGGMTNEIFKTVDRMAREAIKKDRATLGRKIGGGIRDFFSDIRGAEKDLHRKRVEIMADLREQFNIEPFDTKNPIYELVLRDVEGREEFARRIGEMPIELLHGNNVPGEEGERRTTVIVDKDSAVDKTLKNQIILPLIRDILSQYDKTGVQPDRISADIRNTFDIGLRDYFMSPEFQQWKNTLPPDQAAALDKSLSHATDFLTQFEETMIPDIITNYDYYKTAESLELQIELTLGTGKYGPNGEIPSNQLFSGEQIELNEDVWKSLSKRAERATDSSPLFGKNSLVNGTSRAFWNAAADVVVKNEITAAIAGTAVTRAVMSAFQLAASPLAVPIGVVFGSTVMAGFKEYIKLRSERAVVDYEEALGYHRKDNAKRFMEMKLHDYNRIEMSHRAQQFSVLLQKQDFSPTDILHLMGLSADSHARIELSDLHNINLLSASKETPNGQSRGLYQKEERLHGLALSAADAKIHELLSNPDLFAQVTKLAGIQTTDLEPSHLDFNIDYAMATLVLNQRNHLESGVKIPESMLAAFNTPEYQLTQKDGESIKLRDDAFESWRRWTSLKHGVKVGAIAGVFSGAVSGLVTLGNSEFELRNDSTLTMGESVDVTLVDSDLPLKTVNISDNNVAHIPMGTTLMPDDGNQPGVFDLVVNATGEHKLDNITFTDGVPNMTRDLIDQAARNHIEITHFTTPEFVPSVEAGPLLENVTIHYDEMPGLENGDADSWFAHNLNQSYAETPPHPIGDLPDVNVDRVTEINAIRYLFHGWEKAEMLEGREHFGIDQIEGVFRKIHYGPLGTAIGAYQAPNAYIEDVPWILGTEHGHRAVADLLRESMQMQAAGVELDQVHQAVYDMGYVGTVDTVPTPEEVALIMDHLNKTATSAPSHSDTLAQRVLHETRFVMTEDLKAEVFVLDPHLNIDAGAKWETVFETAGIGVGYTQGLESPAEERLKLDKRQAAIIPHPNNPELSSGNQSNQPGSPQVASSNIPRPRIKYGEPKGSLDISAIRQDIAAEVAEELSQNEESLAEGGIQANLAIRKMMAHVADKHKLPIAYLIQGGRVKLLTRPPEELDKKLKNRGRIYYFNTTTGKEESEEIDIKKVSRDESIIYMSGLSNFPPGSSDKTSGVFTDYDSANQFFQSIEYDLSGWELPSTMKVEDKEGAWSHDMVIATAFALKAFESKQAIPKVEVDDERVDFHFDLDNKMNQIGDELVKIIDPSIDTNNITKESTTKFVSALNKIDITTFEGAKAIHAIIDQLADKHGLPIAYIIRDGRVRMLTRPPEPIDDKQSKVYYYDAQHSTEQEMILDISSKESREPNQIHFSGEENFGIVDDFKIINSDHSSAAAMMKQASYSYQTIHTHESIPLDDDFPAWIQDVVTSLGYAGTVRDRATNFKTAQELLDEMIQRIKERKAKEL